MSSLPPTRVPKNFDKPLLSASTILILSGFLIGLTVGRVVGEDLSPFVLACGLAGFLSYLGLDVAATRRKEEMLASEQRQMELRLDKHVMSLSSAGFVLPTSDVESLRRADRSRNPEKFDDPNEDESISFQLSQL